MHNGVVCYVVHTSTTLKHIEPRYSPHIHIYFRLHTSSSGETLFFCVHNLDIFLTIAVAVFEWPSASFFGQDDGALIRIFGI